MPDFTDLQKLPELLAGLYREVEELRGLRQELAELRERLPKWVTDEQAQEITGLSRDTLRRARKVTGSLLVYKEDHGLRYDYDSLLRYNKSRALGRGRLSQLLTSTPV